MAKDEQLRGSLHVGPHELCQPPEHLDDDKIEHPNPRDQMMADINKTPAHRPYDKL